LALAHRFETMRAKLQTLLLDSDDACTSEFCMFFYSSCNFQVDLWKRFSFSVLKWFVCSAFSKVYFSSSACLNMVIFQCKMGSSDWCHFN
jgi:hypothetical protein